MSNNIKNADLTAMPCHTQSTSNSFGGLTKREELAARNMAAILSSLPHWEAMGYKIESDSDYAKQAIDAADALLAELDE